MALQKNISTNVGLTLNDAYIKIDEQSGTKESLNLRVRNYVSKNAREQGRDWVSEAIYTFTPSVEDGSLNFIRQGYEYLKTLPEFEDAVDA